MKYNESTSIGDIIQYAKEEWRSFSQGIVNQDIYNWLINNGDNENAEKLRLIHSDIGSEFPHLAALYIFSVLEQVPKVNGSAKNAAQAFMQKYSDEIAKESKEVSEKYYHFSTLIGQSNQHNVNRANSPLNNKIMGFLLFNDGYSNTVYLINEGINTYGTQRSDEESHHLIVTAEEPLLKSKHFSIKAEARKNPYVRVFDSCSSFLIHGTDEFREGELNYGTELVLGKLKITMLQHL